MRYSYPSTRSRFFPNYSVSEILEKEYSVAARLHLDPSVVGAEWDLLKLHYFAENLAKDVREEEKKLQQLMNSFGQH